MTDFTGDCALYRNRATKNMRKEIRMKKSIKCAVRETSLHYAVIFVFLLFAASCATGGSPQQGSPAAGGNPWVGLWEGEDNEGFIYSFYFSNTEWESYIESSGITIPFYKGTYSFTSTRVTLQVIEEGNTSTMGWMPHKDNFPPITGRLSGSKLSLPTFTDVDLIKE